MYALVFDTESCDPKNPMIIQISWCVHDIEKENEDNIVEHDCLICDVDDNKQWTFYGHNLKRSDCKNNGEYFEIVMSQFISDMEYADIIVAHNYTSDLCKIAKDLHDRKEMEMYDRFMNVCRESKFVDTMKIGKDVFKKQMKNSELYIELTNQAIDVFKLHDALYDVYLTKENHVRLRKRVDVKLTNYENIENIMKKYINKSQPNHYHSPETILNNECL